VSARGRRADLPVRGKERQRWILEVVYKVCCVFNFTIITAPISPRRQRPASRNCQYEEVGGGAEVNWRHTVRRGLRTLLANSQSIADWGTQRLVQNHKL
jgi:hypothetical protein